MGSRVAIADSASRPARANGGSSTAGGRIRSSCSATTSAIVWLRRLALRMYAAIWVSNATLSPGPADPGGELFDQQRLGLVRDEPDADPGEEVAQDRRIPGSLDRHGPAVWSGDGHRDRRARQRPRIVADQRGADGGMGRQPRFDGADGVAGEELDPAARVDDRSRQRTRQVRRGFDRTAGAARHRRPAGTTGTDRCRVHRREVQRQLEAAPLTDQRSGRGCPHAPRPAGGRRTPAGRPTGDLGGPDGLARVSGPERLHGLVGTFAGQRGQPLDERAELVLAEQADHALPVVVAQPSGFAVELDRDVADDRHQLAGFEDAVLGLDEGRPELLARDLVDPLEQPLEAAERLDQLGGGLVADPGNARDVVGRIALQGLEVDHLGRDQAVPFEDAGRVVDDRVLDTRTGRHQPGPVGHQLEHVQVPGHDRRVEPVALGLDGERPDDVVRLVARELVDGDPQSLDDLADLGELVAQVVGHPLAGRLVVREPLVTEGRAGQVERHRDVGRIDVLEPAEDDAAEPEDRVDELALRRRQGWEREVSAVDEPVAVEQHQAFHRQASGRGRVDTVSVPAPARPSGRGVACHRRSPPRRRGRRRLRRCVPRAVGDRTGRARRAGA